MAMPGSGAISLLQANQELGRSGGATISMNDAELRALAGVGGSGTNWAMSALYGKSAFAATISGSMGTTNSGGNISYSRGTYSIIGATGITGYTWVFTDYGGQATITATNAATVTITGPSYNRLNASTQTSFALYCDVVINGQTKRVPAIGGNYRIAQV